MVTGLENFDLDKALNGMKQYFDVTEIAEADVDKALSENADNKANVLAAPDGKFYLSVMKADAGKKLSEMNPDKSDSYKGLDVTVLHSLILENVLGIDKENMAQQINLKYTRDKAEAIDAVKSGKANCSFIINATKVEEIKAVALANEKMPQKSTYFYPKLITGLVMNRLADTDILR